MRMHCIVICDLPGCTVFSTLSHTRHEFCKETVIEDKMCFIICITFVWNISILRRTERDVIKKLYIGVHVEDLLLLQNIDQI
jgi:hypothetical protein